MNEQEFGDAKYSTKLFKEKIIQEIGENLNPTDIRQQIKNNRDYGRQEDISVFHFLGDVTFNGEKAYVTSNGVINKDGPVKNCSVDIPGNYSSNSEYFKLPGSKAETKKSIDQCLSLLLPLERKDRFFGQITIPIATRSLLTDIAPVKFAFFFIGDSGNLKSTGAAVLQSFSFPGITEESLSLNFDSTPNAMRLFSSILKNSTVIIDDYNTSKVDDVLSEFLTLGSSKTTPRMTAKSASELDQPVKTNTTIIVTGEHPLNTDKDSRHARVIYIEFLPNSIPIKKLSEIQKLAAQGVYFKAMIIFKQWILGNHERLVVEVKEKYEYFREKAAAELPDGTHRRLCENTADFFIGLYFFIDFCIEKGYLAEKDGTRYLDPYWKRIKRIISRQQEIIADYEPKGVFVRFIKKALSNGRLYLMSKNGFYIDDFRPLEKDDGSAGKLLGYVKDESGVFMCRLQLILM